MKWPIWMCFSESNLISVIKADENPPSWFGIIGRDTCHREQGCGLNLFGGGEPCHEKDTGLLYKQLPLPLVSTARSKPLAIAGMVRSPLFSRMFSPSPLLSWCFPCLLIFRPQFHSPHLSQIHYTITFNNKLLIYHVSGTVGRCWGYKVRQTLLLSLEELWCILPDGGI